MMANVDDYTLSFRFNAEHNSSVVHAACERLCAVAVARVASPKTVRLHLIYRFSMEYQ